MPDAKPPWEAGYPFAEEQEPKRPAPAPQRSTPPPRAQAPRPRAENGQGPLPQGALAKAGQAIEGLQYDADGAPVFENEDMMFPFMQRLIDNGFLSKQLDTPAKAINAMGVCKAAGLPWQTWINKTYFIDNKIAVYIEFLLAAATATGKMARCDVAMLNADGEVKTRHNMKGFEIFACEATVRNIDYDEPQTIIWSKEDVAKSGKGNNPNYGKYPGDMLMWRALGRALRLQFPLANGGALIQGVHDDMEPLLDDTGKAVRGKDGSALFQNKAAARERLQQLMQAKGEE